MSEKVMAMVTATCKRCHINITERVDLLEYPADALIRIGWKRTLIEEGKISTGYVCGNCAVKLPHKLVFMMTGLSEEHQDEFNSTMQEFVNLGVSEKDREMAVMRALELSKSFENSDKKFLEHLENIKNYVMSGMIVRIAIKQKGELNNE